MSDLIKIAVDAMGGDGSPKKVNRSENMSWFLKSLYKSLFLDNSINLL